MLMNRLIPLTIGATAGGLAVTALLSTGVAFAAGDEAAGGAASAAASTPVFPEVPGHDAFTIGQATFDPFTVTNGAEVEGFAPVNPLFGFPPITDIGGGNVSLLGSSLPLAEQAFDVYSTGAAPSLLGIVNANEDVANILGMTNTEFTISQVGAVGGVQDSALPADGTVYDVFNLGHGLENVYVDVPGTAGGTVTDTFVTPFGSVDLSSLFAGFDATQPIDPGGAFTGLTDVASGSAASLGDLFSL